MMSACVTCRSCTMRRSWTCLTEVEIQRIAAGSPTSESTRTPTAASTPQESLPDWCSQRTRWVLVYMGGLFGEILSIFYVKMHQFSIIAQLETIFCLYTKFCMILSLSCLSIRHCLLHKPRALAD